MNKRITHYCNINGEIIIFYRVERKYYIAQVRNNDNNIIDMLKALDVEKIKLKELGDVALFRAALNKVAEIPIGVLI